jgi:hypothetical protein
VRKSAMMMAMSPMSRTSALLGAALWLEFISLRRL